MAFDFRWCFLAVLLLLPLVYKLSGTFRYYAKMTLYLILLNVAAGVVFILSLRRPFDVRNFHYAAKAVHAIQHLYGVEVEVLGADQLEGDEPCVLVANHQTCLDGFGFAKVWPRRCAMLMKRSLQYIFPYGLAATLVGTVFIDRSKKESAIATMGRIGDTIKKNKIKVFIFPEGTRNRDGGMKPFKRGAFHLAVQAQVPIQPVVFSSYTDFYSRKEKRFDKGKLVVTCMPKISTVGLTAEDVPAFTDKVREQMLTVFNQMNAKTQLVNGDASSS